MSTIIVITPPPKRENRTTEGTEDETTIKVKLEGEGSVADLLREAADVIEGNA